MGRGVEPGRDQIANGHDPGVLRQRNDLAFVLALKQSHCKAMLIHTDGTYEEVILPLGHSGASVAATRCYMNLETSVPQLKDWMTPAQLHDQTIDRVNAYVSPPGHGTPLHFDIRTVWIVQLFGEKTWHVSDRPAIPNPHRNCVAGRESGTIDYDGTTLALPDKLHMIVMRPGDWMRVSRGVWHKTFSATGSVSVTLAAPA